VSEHPLLVVSVAASPICGAFNRDACGLQIHRSFRKPLIIFTPKNLLRHPKAKSKLLEFDDKADDPNIVGVRFKRLIMDNRETDRAPNPEPRPDVKRLVFCSGKVYYELEAAREAASMDEAIAICRVEQLAPFPFDLVMRELKRYPEAQVCHCFTCGRLGMPWTQLAAALGHDCRCCNVEASFDTETLACCSCR
jgi:2-oxoglutarate dehydrogenase C-terminal